MFKMFQRKSKVSPYIECRSWHGVSFHIRDIRNTSGQALCHYDPLDDRSPITFDEYQLRAQHQHDGWKYCSDCARIFELLHDNDKAVRLIHEAYDLSAGRWCDACHEWGSHHSDRHQEMIAGAVLNH